MFRIGQSVTDRYGEEGEVRAIYDNFSACSFECMTMTGKHWLDAQLIPFTEEQLNERWYSVRFKTGGSVWSPESLLSGKRVRK